LIAFQDLLTEQATLTRELVQQLHLCLHALVLPLVVLPVNACSLARDEDGHRAKFTQDVGGVVGEWLLVGVTAVGVLLLAATILFDRVRGGHRGGRRRCDIMGVVVHLVLCVARNLAPLAFDLS